MKKNIGMRVMFNMGIDNGKTGTIVDNSLLPKAETEGEYKPFDPKRESLVRVDNDGKIRRWLKAYISHMPPEDRLVTEQEKREVRTHRIFPEAKPITGAQTRLERHVQKWINDRAKDYPDNGAAGVLKDLFQGGCASGYVGHLIYYRDTVKFFQTHRREISEMFAQALQDSSDTADPVELFGDKWDAFDPFAQETLNRNLLAWFGFEETARKLAERNGIEI